MTITKDSWLSDQLARDCYKVTLTSANRFAELEQLTKQKGIFAYSKVNASDIEHVAILEQLGFRLVDTNIVFDKPISREVESYSANVRHAAPLDEWAVAALAGSCFSFSRFHLDKNFSEATANKIKAEWARNYFLGTRGNAMIVAEIAGEIVGFLQLIAASHSLVIDLIGVSAKQRGRGIATEMIQFAEEQIMTDDGAEFESIVVGTQVANAASVRLYEKLGFRLKSASYVFHFHS